MKMYGLVMVKKTFSKRLTITSFKHFKHVMMTFMVNVPKMLQWYLDDV